MNPLEENREQFIKDLNVQGGFTVPEGYFEQLDKRLQDITEEPQLQLKGESGGFFTPENYFSKLEGKILEKVARPKAKIIPLYRKPVFWLSAAIAASLLFVSLLFLFNDNKPAEFTDRQKAVEHELTESELIEYLNDEGYHLDQLCDAGWCNEFNNLKKESDPLENYLQEHANEGLLMEEL